MKAIISLSKFGLFLLIFLLHSCSKEETAPNGIEGNWIVVSFENYQTSTSTTKTEENTWGVSNNGDITVDFSLSNNTNGLISGKNVTNNFQGEFIIGPDLGLTIRNISITRIGEPEWGRMFHSINLAESYEVDENQLVIYYNNKENAIVLERP